MDYLLAALLSGFFLFNGAVTPGRAAKIAERGLQKQHPNGEIHVQIEGKRGKAVLAGNFRRVRVEMANVALSGLPFEPPQPGVKTGHAGKIEIDLRRIKLGNLPVSRAALDFEAVDYDLNALKKQAQFRVVRMGAAHLQLQLDTQALLPAFAAKLKDTSDVTLQTDGQTLTFGANRAAFGSVTPLKVTGQLAVAGSQLRLENPLLFIAGTRVPDVAARVLLKDLNPLYDFDARLKWPFHTQLTSVSGAANQLDLRADLTLAAPAALNSSP